MLKYDGKEFRNLEEQVRKNQDDIEKILNEVQLADLGIKIVQVIPLPTTADLPLPYDGDYGDGFLVGEEAPYELYIWTRANNAYNGAWFDWGVLNAPSIVPGPQGEKGETGPQGERGSLWTSNNGAPTVSQNNKNGDQFLNTANGNVYEYQNGVWNIIGNIKGPQGLQGVQGPKGDTGAQGLQGIQGPQGEPGQWIQIIDELANTDQLPDPDSVPRYYAYIIPVSGVNHLYVISGDETLLWLDSGVVGAQGPQGEKGETGEQGIQGVGIASIESETSSQTQDGYTQTPITITKTDNSTTTVNVLAKNGATVNSVTVGTPTSSGGYTTTPITFNYSDNTNQTVNVQAKDGEFAQVDNELSSASENPVQNKIITNALDTKANANNVYTKTETDNLLIHEKIYQTTTDTTGTYSLISGKKFSDWNWLIFVFYNENQEYYETTIPVEVFNFSTTRKFNTVGGGYTGSSDRYIIYRYYSDTKFSVTALQNMKLVEIWGYK